MKISTNYVARIVLGLFMFISISGNAQELTVPYSQEFTEAVPYLTFKSAGGTQSDKYYKVLMAVLTADSIKFIDSTQVVNSSKDTLSLRYTYSCIRSTKSPVLTTAVSKITKVINKLANPHVIIVTEITPDESCKHNPIYKKQSNLGRMGNFIAFGRREYQPFTYFKRNKSGGQYNWSLIFYSGGENKNWYSTISPTQVKGTTVSTEYYTLGLIARDQRCEKGSSCGMELNTDLPFQAIQFTIKPQTFVREARLQTFVDVNLPDPDVPGSSSTYVDEDDPR